MGADYIPAQELAMDAWSANFAALIAAAPATYGLMESDAAGISAVQSAFNAALLLATNPATKTKATVADKDAKKAVMLTLLRHYAQTIKRNLGISNQTKAALGLTLDAPGKTPVPAPATAPVLRVAQIDHMRHTLRYCDESTPDRRGKPAGAKSLQLFRYVGPNPPQSPEQAAFVGVITKQPVTVTQDSAAAGQNAYYFGRWATHTGLVGPASALVSAPIIA